MADLPIIFSAPMIHALLREIKAPGTGKTQTRRICGLFGSLDPEDIEWNAEAGDFNWRGQREFVGNGLPRYSVGDRLYVREAHKMIDLHCDYRADWPEVTQHLFRWRPSIHMPRWASRITLIVTEVRVERLQDCSEADAKAEGIIGAGLIWGLGVEPPDAARAASPVEAYARLWGNINGPGAWAANPWVAAYTFRPIFGNIDQIGGAA